MSSTLIPTLTSLTVEIAFVTAPISTTPTWVDVTADLISFKAKRGRANELGVFDIGTLSMQLKNTTGDYDADYQSGAHLGYILPGRKVRISAVYSGTTYRIWTGYIDSWTRSWPAGTAWSVTDIEARDRFAMLAEREFTLLGTADEHTDVRIAHILAAASHGAANVVPSAECAINVDGYTCRSVAGYDYDEFNALQALQDLAQAEGGQLFMAGDGKLTFQGTNFRTMNTRSTTQQAHFGNTAVAGYDATTGEGTGVGPLTELAVVADSLRPVVDRTRLVNYVTVTDCNSDVHVTSNSTSIGQYGPITADIGATLLLSADADDRIADVLVRFKDPNQRHDSFAINAYAYTKVMEQALKREISDRVQLRTISPGDSSGYERDYVIESIEHDVTSQSWVTTFGLSPKGSSALAIP